MIKPATNPIDPVTVALHALAVTIQDEQRAERLLALSGIAPGDLRERASDPLVLAAVLRFLEAHEPDLLSVSEQLGRKPEELVAARSALEA